MDRSFLTWVLLVLFALALIAMGVQGNLGRVVAVIFTPASLEVAN